MGLTALALPQATGAVEIPLSDDAATAVWFWPAITAVAPIMIIMAIIHNVLNAVFIISSFCNC
jgi:hypothetical protein